jgi:ribonuclease D
MPISVTITADDPTELQGWARLLLGMNPGEIDGTVAVTAAAAEALQRAVDPKRTRGPNKPKEAAEKAKEEPAKAAEAEAPKEGEILPPEGSKLTADDLRAEMKRISADHGIEATRKLLERMGVARLGDVEPAKYAEFMSVAKTWTGA